LKKCWKFDCASLRVPTEPYWRKKILSTNAKACKFKGIDLARAQLVE
jgi:hypothetical protein